MNLEEVKEHFKNAKEVVSTYGNSFSYDLCYKDSIHNDGVDVFITDGYRRFRCLYDGTDKCFAEIISYKKDAQRIQEDCELLDKFLADACNLSVEHIGNSVVTNTRCYKYIYETDNDRVMLFKKDNDLIIEPTELDKLKQSHAELMEKAEEIKQQIDNLK